MNQPESGDPSGQHSQPAPPHHPGPYGQVPYQPQLGYGPHFVGPGTTQHQSVAMKRGGTGTENTLHIILTILTCGVWGLVVWLPIVVFRSMRSPAVVSMTTATTPGTQYYAPTGYGPPVPGPHHPQGQYQQPDQPQAPLGPQPPPPPS